MKKSTIRRLPLSSHRTRNASNDTQVQDDFDDLVMNASRGDSRAVGAIAVALGPMILGEARAVLGEYSHEAEDVLQDFLLFMLDGRSPFRPAHGRAVPWMCRMVRAIAQTRRKEKGWRT
jgi:DNA-directed RNA polymerase specialized sigma24 family protein